MVNNHEMSNPRGVHMKFLSSMVKPAPEVLYVIKGIYEWTVQ